MEYVVEKKKAIGLIHKVYLSQLKSSRKYNAFTKTKSEVRGGGRKPWKQKGTGQARAGSTRSPLWVGGGVIFGPKPRIVIKKINKKEKKLAILSALYLKTSKLLFVEDNILESSFSNAKTKEANNFFDSLEIPKNAAILLILGKSNKATWFATRNLKKVETTTPEGLNILQLLKADCIILSKNSLEKINSIYGK
jgi:large subunit ribosomal protein L4